MPLEPVLYEGGVTRGATSASPARCKVARGLCTFTVRRLISLTSKNAWLPHARQLTGNQEVLNATHHETVLPRCTRGVLREGKTSPRSSKCRQDLHAWASRRGLLL